VFSACASGLLATTGRRVFRALIQVSDGRLPDDWFSLHGVSLFEHLLVSIFFGQDRFTSHSLSSSCLVLYIPWRLLYPTTRTSSISSNVMLLRRRGVDRLGWWLTSPGFVRSRGSTHT